MTTLLADAAKLRLIVAHHAGDDADLPVGTHLRWLADPAWGLPLTPLELWRVNARPMPLDPNQVAWFAPDGSPMAAGDLAAHGRATVLVQAPREPWPQVLGLEARASHDQPVQMRLLSATNEREIARRSTSPCILAVPGPWHLALEGRHVTELRAWAVSRTDVLKAVTGLAPTLRLGPPLDRAAWHVDGLGEDEAWGRVKAGAPLREPWIDRPEAAPQALQPADELARLAEFADEWRQRCRALLDDSEQPPARAEEVHEWAPGVDALGRTRPWQRITGLALETWHAAALDTGLGRWLGMMTALPDVPRRRDDLGREVGEAWVLAGVFAEPDGAGAAPDELERTQLERRMAEQPALAELVAQLPRFRLRARLQVAVALNAPFAQAPQAPAPQEGSALWESAAPQADPFEHRFSRRLLLPNPPAAALLGVAWLNGGVWQPRHARSSGDRPRSRVRLPGSLRLADRARRAGVPAALVDEAGLSAEGSPWPCRIVLGDLFGRYGPAVDAALAPPPRPPVPTPSLRATLRRDWPAPAGDGAAQLADAQPLPDPVWSAEVSVPAPADLPGGALPITSLEWQLDGAALPAGIDAAPVAGGVVTRQWPVNPAAPFQTSTSTLEVRFVDTDGRRSDWASVSERWVDGRLPVIPQVGQGLLWTSHPASAEQVELRLRVPAPPAGDGVPTRCRVYLTDTEALGIARRNPDGTPRSRAELGRLAAALPPERTAQRDAFRLALAEPVKPGADGRCLIPLLLPRALQTVQLLRIVPMSDSGQEPSFAQCPLLPLAVPTDRRPPAPRVEAWFDEASGRLDVRISAQGLDVVQLRADEPGSFQSPALEGSARPRWRLRMASGAVPQPFYARTLAEGELEWNEAHQVFEHLWSSERAPEGWPAYVPLTLWAEVAMPPERRLPLGVELQAWPGGAVEPGHAAALADCPRPYSECSASARVIRVPSVPAALSADAVVASAAPAGPDQWTLSLDIQGPKQHSAALNPYRVEAAQAGQGSDWQPLALPSGGALQNGRLLANVLVSSAPAPERLRVKLIDPLGVGQPQLEVRVAQA